MEIWKDIPDHYPYQASSQGRIQNASTKRILSSNPSSGYQRVGIRPAGQQWQTRPVHRLVALAFLGVPSDEALVVNHKNGNTQDNRPENLEFITSGDNTRHYHEEIKKTHAVMIRLRTNHCGTIQLKLTANSAVTIG